MNVPEKAKCENCPHRRKQHDEDGFCEVETDDVICDCTGFEEKID